MEENLLNIVKDYKKVISEFKKRSGVLSGFDVAWKGNLDVALLANTPYGIGDALGTTGWCVSASEALLNDNIFQLTLRFRSAKAKLISIDIKEQYYGYCYNGSQNKWHTAILVEDSGFTFIVDITCRQFGNSFIEKDIWDFNTWIDTLRHPLCNHKLTNFLDNPLLISPVVKKSNNNKDLSRIISMDKLRNFTNLDESDRSIITDFYLNKLTLINEKLILGTVSKEEFNYLNSVIKILQIMPFRQITEGFSVLEFENKTAAKRWIELFLTTGNTLPIYLNVSSSINQSCIYNNIDFLDLNNEYIMGNENNPTYVVLQFGKQFGIETPIDNTEILLTNGIMLPITNPKESIFNSGKLFTPEKSTNTIYIKID